jgi:signal transduction histidine kinase
MSGDDERRSAALGRLYEATGSLVVGFAHEMYNPLFALSATVDALELRLAPGVGDEHVRVLRAQIDRIVTLTRELLAYGSPQALELEFVSFDDLLLDAMATVRPGADQAGVRLVLAIDSGLPELRIDRDRVARAIADVVARAVRASPPHGRVAISGAHRVIDATQKAEVEIRVDARTVGRFDMDSVGYAVARKVVLEHGGTIDAVGSARGGTLVRIRLPVTPRRDDR